jgi:hypothetical protein
MRPEDFANEDSPITAWAFYETFDREAQGPAEAYVV